MRKLLQSALAALLFGVLIAVAAPPARASAPIVVAANRCNARTIDEANARLNDYASHPPGNRTTQLWQRYGAIAEVLETLSEEHEVLQNLCTTDEARAPLFADIAATAASALMLQADITARLNASCPAAARGLPTLMVADAWLSLARVVNDSGGTVPPVFNGVIPKVRAHADALGLTLPAWSDTSTYWRDSLRDRINTEVAGCPSPSPPPAPGDLRTIRK